MLHTPEANFNQTVTQQWEFEIVTAFSLVPYKYAFYHLLKCIWDLCNLMEKDVIYLGVL